MLREIHLHGVLGEEFGQLHLLDVESAAEAIRALLANFTEFRPHIESNSGGLGYSVLLGKESVGENQLHHPAGRRPIHFVPVFEGDSDKPWVQIVVGIILIAVAVFFPPLAGASAGTWAAYTAQALIYVGVGLILGGVGSLITGTQEFDFEGDDAEGTRASKFFSGPRNTVTQGRPVPVVVGQMWVGSATVSVGIRNVDD